MGPTFWKVLLLVGACAASLPESSPPEEPRQAAIPATTSSSSPTLIPLKHRRYKSYRGNITDTTRSQHHHQQSSTNHVVNIVPEDDDPHHNHNHFDSDHFGTQKSSRSGLQLQKSPPDLQFGLAFTVPFVSLSTEKLLHSVSGKNFDSVSSLLKLNFSGLLLAAVVGIVAVAGLFLPTLLGPGGLGGWGAPWLDGLVAPHFTGDQYNDYENGWNKGAGWLNNNKEWLGRNGRGIENALFGVFNKVRSGVEGCVVERVCEDVKSGHQGKLVELVNEISTNELVQNVGVVQVLQRVVGGDFSKCGKVKGCERIQQLEDMVGDVIKGWSGNGTDKSSA